MISRAQMLGPLHQERSSLHDRSSLEPLTPSCSCFLHPMVLCVMGVASLQDGVDPSKDNTNNCWFLKVPILHWDGSRDFSYRKSVLLMHCALANNIINQPTSTPSHWVMRELSHEDGRGQGPQKSSIVCPVFIIIFPDHFISGKCHQQMMLYLAGNDNDGFL